MTQHPVKQRRKEAGFSIAELAEYTGLSSSTICQIENRSSQYKTNVGVAMILADTFGCKVSDLFNRDELSHLGRPPLTGSPISITASFSVSITESGVTNTYTLTHEKHTTARTCGQCFIEMPRTGICDTCN